MPSEVRLNNFQFYSLFKYLKQSFLGQYLVGGQGQGGMALCPPWVRHWWTPSDWFIEFMKIWSQENTIKKVFYNYFFKQLPISQSTKRCFKWSLPFLCFWINSDFRNNLIENLDCTTLKLEFLATKFSIHLSLPNLISKELWYKHKVVRDILYFL